MVLLKTIALILFLGIDTLMISISIGFVQAKGKMKIGIIFAFTEAIMPLLGLFIGKTAGQFIGNWASIVGGIVLLLIALWLLFFEDEEEEIGKLERNLVGWTLIVTAFSISLDELAIGFSIGIIGVPIYLTILLIALQAFLFTIIGITFGSKLKQYLGEWTEKLAGIVLGLLGIWIVFEAIIKLLR